MTPRILRPVRETPFISAKVFEHLFTTHLGAIFDICKAPLISWSNKIFGSSESPHSFRQAAQKFYHETRDFDYFCPAYECMPLAPFFIALRNASRANIRLLFIAHSPGAYPLEWALLKPLLVSGDVIIAPGNSAKKVIEFLCPELSPFVKIIHHPIELLAPEPTDSAPIKRIVTLSRITEAKLLHRQIEAMALLNKRGYENLRMEVAGSLNVDEDPAKEIKQYVRSLQAKIERLGLEKQVRLIGPIHGRREKTKFLSGASMSVNLSLSIEEACPKASIEPLGLGIPVVAVQWDGFVETVGDAGVLVPVLECSDGVLDVRAEDIADAIELVLNNSPSPETCRKQAERFVPTRIKNTYQQILQEGMQYKPSQTITGDTFSEYEGRASELKGILGHIAILSLFSWKELLTLLIGFSQKLRQQWEGKQVTQVYRGEIIRTLLVLSTKSLVEYCYAGKDLSKWMRCSGQDHQVVPKPTDFVEKIAKSIQSRALITSKEACLFSLIEGKQVVLLEECLEYLETHHEDLPNTMYYQIELERLKENYSKAYDLFIQHYRSEAVKEHEGHLLRQIAKICRKWNKPELALAWLRKWLFQYPDSPQSGMIWLDLSANAYYAGEQYRAEAKDAIQKAERLLGNVPAIQKLQQNIMLQSILAGMKPSEKL